VPDVQNFHRISHSVEYLVGVTGDKDHTHIGIVGPITTVWMLFELLYRLQDARGDISRAVGRSLVQIFKYSLSI